MRWMKLLPYRRVSISTSLAPEVALETLRGQVDAPTLANYFFGGSPQRFRGVVSDDGYRLELSRPRWPVRPNYYWLAIRGTVVRTDDGADLDVRLRLRFGAAFFFSYGLFVSMALAVFSLSAGLRGLPALLLPLLIVTLLSVGFAREARRAESALRAVFPRPEEAPEGPFR